MSNPPTPRVVSLLPGGTEIVLALGAGDELVGLSHLCHGPEGRALARVLSTRVDSQAWSMQRIDAELRAAFASGAPLYDLDEQAIRALEPTHVISQGLCPVCAVTPESVAPALRGRCAELLVLSPHSLADVARDMRTVGAALGRAEAGERAARAFERAIEAVRELPRLAPVPRVGVLEWFEPLWASGEWIAEMVEAAGGGPVLARADETSKRITWEELVAADPDVVVLAACSMSIARTERELGALFDRPEWAGLRAVRAERVFLIDGERHASTPGPGLAEGAEVLADLLRAPPSAESPRWKRLPAPR